MYTSSRINSARSSRAYLARVVVIAAASAVAAGCGGDSSSPEPEGGGSGTGGFGSPAGSFNSGAGGSGAAEEVTSVFNQRLISQDGETYYARNCDVLADGSLESGCGYSGGALVSGLELTASGGGNVASIRGGYAYTVRTGDGTLKFFQRLIDGDGTGYFSRDCTLNSDFSLDGDCPFSGRRDISGLVENVVQDGYAYTHTDAEGTTFLHQRMIADDGMGIYSRDCKLTDDGSIDGACPFSGARPTGISEAVGGGYAFTYVDAEGTTQLLQRYFTKDGTGYFARDCALQDDGSLETPCEFGDANATSGLQISGVTAIRSGYAY